MEKTASASQKMPNRGNGPRMDFRPHYGRSIFFVSVFIGVFSYVKFSTNESRNQEAVPGLRFHKNLNSWVSDEVLYFAPLAYVVAVLFGCRLMQESKSFELLVRIVQPLYNILQIVVCGYMVYGLFPSVGIWNGRLPFAMNSPFSKELEYFVFIHYLTKYLDLCDTLFMVSRKKFNQVSFLHVFHHATIGLVWGFLLREGVGSGTAAFGAWMNSLTHVIMYTHYLVTSFGINNPFKRYITTWQLFQFATCLLHSVCVLSLPYEAVLPKVYAWMQVMYQSFMLLLFGLYMNWVPSWLIGYNPELEKKKN